MQMNICVAAWEGFETATRAAAAGTKLCKYFCGKLSRHSFMKLHKIKLKMATALGDFLQHFFFPN